MILRARNTEIIITNHRISFLFFNYLIEGPICHFVAFYFRKKINVFKTPDFLTFFALIIFTTILPAIQIIRKNILFNIIENCFQFYHNFWYNRWRWQWKDPDFINKFSWCFIFNLHWLLHQLYYPTSNTSFAITWCTSICT